MCEALWEPQDYARRGPHRPISARVRVTFGFVSGASGSEERLRVALDSGSVRFDAETSLLALLLTCNTSRHENRITSVMHGQQERPRPGGRGLSRTRDDAWSFRP